MTFPGLCRASVGAHRLCSRPYAQSRQAWQSSHRSRVNLPVPELRHVSEDQEPRLPRSTAVPGGVQALCGTTLRYVSFGCTPGPRGPIPCSWPLPTPGLRPPVQPCFCGCCPFVVHRHRWGSPSRHRGWTYSEGAS